MSEAVRYRVTFSAPETHYAEIEVSVPTGGRNAIELRLPAWTPGSYRIRDHSRHIEGLRAETSDGQPLETSKLAKNRWRVATSPDLGRVVVSYRVYGHEATVRTNFVDSRMALLNGAATFLSPPGAASSRHEVDVVLPARWTEVVTLLEPAANGGPHRYVAPDYDTLVDSPIFVGSPRIHSWSVDGVPHRLVDQGGDGVWSSDRARRDVEAITRAECAFWGTIPYRRYTFLNLINGGRGGLEHREGSVLMTKPYATRTRSHYLDWLSLVSHELFHAWNVKRLRPRELGPFDYDTENHTRALWAAEGITSYYDDLLVHRAGLSTREEYLAALSKQIKRLQSTPGRRVRSLEEASFDAWIKLYQPDANTDNTVVSYYVKGAVVAFLLDARIRVATDGAASLDDAMRRAFAEHSGPHGFETGQIEDLFSEVAGTDLGSFFDLALRSVDELPYIDALDHLGLRFVPDEEDAANEPMPAAWLGAETTPREGRLRVTRVPRGTPAHRAGIDVGDELLAVDGYRLPRAGLGPRLAAYRPEESVRFTLSRRGVLRELDVVLGAPPHPAWNLAVDPEADTDQARALAAWLRTPPEDPAATR